MELAIACGIAVVVSLTELLSRYHHLVLAPGVAGSLALYLLVNVAASALAVVLVGSPEAVQAGIAAESSVTNALIAGFGATAFLRSSFFNYRVGDKEINVGPAAVLDVLRYAADRGLDQRLATGRAERVPTIMAKVDFTKAHVCLPALCLTLMQNIPKEEQDGLGEQIGKLVAASMPDAAKAVILGLLIVNLVGEEALEKAVGALGATIQQGGNG